MGLFSIFGRTAPATVPTDRIVPLRYWDDLHYLRSICHDFTLRFDDVLDVSKLEASLTRLMGIGDWGQLGARLRLNAKGKLEYHIPVRYDEERPAFVFTTSKYDMSIQDHPLGSQLPGANQDQSFLSPSSETFAPLVRHPGSPKELADWIYTDRPQLHIHVTLFQDTTLLTLSYVHTFSDAISRTNFLNAWLAVLRGRECDIPAFLPYDFDPLRKLGREASGKNYSNFRRLLTGFSLIIFGVRLLFEMYWFRNVEEHPIRLPKRCVGRMRTKVLEKLAAADPKGVETPFVSEGDVIISWWVKTLTSALKVAPDRTIMVMNVFNVWSLFPECFPQGAAGFISNGFFYSYTLLTASKVRKDTDLDYVASTNRKALLEHRTRDQVQAMTALQRAAFMQAAPLVGDSKLLFMAATNKHKARYFELDFSAAVVSPGVPLNKRPHALGRPSYINDIEYCQSYPTRNIVKIIGKDAAGDWHLLFKTRAAAWPAIHTQLMELIDMET
ncbi:hypothetical protein N7499_001254 [Penicillium canescens]|uniref:LysR family regulatory protein n=1 Tax=Penicillium canescens TaxID=5083 RepID=A0AAD6I434_PENCN|nr:uncharacterized protein N7446_003608 [Penicillium canescens]KAJ6008695.1 hypothetical protein N7522_003711 [Penicillium canescens]KAJ6027795.1 hypothetical protein N7460_012612 [Penicillium canescens]KAJ6041076.1 hypothetical protein N7444_009981 [Penicillium canescens]KAJ6066571.1 hypothetical protein N7446_003608 [Penicillium canescens]KAJ6101624.1 hypothetical protein N7499_001254 [Penicillium canescens]